MSELKAMILVGIGALLLSAASDIVLLKLHASGEMLFVCSIALVGVLASIAMTLVIKHYEAVERRRQREEVLLKSH
jgi:hypothetical protein